MSIGEIEHPINHTEPACLCARITCVIFALGPGGAERNMTVLSRHLMDAGHEVVMLTMDEDIDDFFLVPDGVRRARLSPELYKMTCKWFDACCQINRWGHLRKEIVATRPDVVVSFLAQANIQVLMSLVGTGVPVIVSERSDPRQVPSTWRWNLLRIFAYTLSFRVVFVSKAVTDWACRMRPWWRGLWIPNPVFLEDRMDGLETPNPRTAGKKTIFALGRLSDEKGFDRLIEAFSRLASRFSSWDLEIIGDGPLRSALIQQIDEKGLIGRVKLLGRVSSPLALLRQGDLFVLSSRFEGFPNALLEAMACGLPVVSFDCSTGPSEIVRQGVDGLLVTQGDIDALAQAMERLMSCEVERIRMARNALDVVNRFSKQRTMALWDGLIRDALACSKRRSE